MYCSIDEAWDNKNSLNKLSKRYNEHFQSQNNELDPYIINSTNKTYNQDKSPLFIPRKDARFNVPKNTPYNEKITDDYDSEIKTEDILEKTEDESSIKYKPKKVNKKIRDMNCHELINKVMSCSTCKMILRDKLKINNNLSFNTLINNEVKEILILILIGLVIIITIDILIRLIK